MRKVLIGILELLIGKRNLLDELTFILAVVTIIIGSLIVIDAAKLIHSLIGTLIVISGIVSVLTVVIPLPKIRDYTDIGSFVILIYGFIKTHSIVAMTISYQAIIIIIIIFTCWKFAIKHLYKKRGE